MQCDYMLCRMKRDINEDPAYSLGAAFFSGFLFSSWSMGIVYVILFLIAYEVFYFTFCCYKKSTWNLLERIGIVAGAFMGFLIGRAIIEEDDHLKSIRDFRYKWKI